MPKRTLAPKFPHATSVLSRIAHFTADQKLTSRSVSVLLIFILLVQVFFIGPVQKTRAINSSSFAGASITGSPQAFQFKQPGRMPDVLTMAALLLPVLPTLFTKQELPESFVPPASPTFSNKLFAA